MPKAAIAATFSLPVTTIAVINADIRSNKGRPKAKATAFMPRLSAPATVTGCPVTNCPASATWTSTSLSFDSVQCLVERL